MSFMPTSKKRNMSVIPWNHFAFIGYTIAISVLCSVAILDPIIFFCTMTGLLPMYIRTWRKKIWCFSVVMCSLGMCLLIVGILALTENLTVKGIDEFMRKKWANINVPEVQMDDNKFWDNVQFQYTCCGWDSASDYSDIPKSCCAIETETCTIENAHGRGCLQAVRQYFTDVLRSILVTVAFISSGICFLMVIVANNSIRLCGLSIELDNNSVL